jgi:hypothetical protein
LIGYGDTNQYHVWIPARKDVLVSRDVKFEDETFGKSGIRAQSKGPEHWEYPKAPKMLDSIKVLPLSATNSTSADKGKRRSLAEIEDDLNPELWDSWTEEEARSQERVGALRGGTSTSGGAKGTGSAKVSGSNGDAKASGSTGGTRAGGSGDKSGVSLGRLDRPGKAEFRTTPFAQAKYYEKRAKSREKKALMAKILADSDNKIEPQSYDEAVNNSTRFEEWRRAINEKYNSCINDRT